MTDRWRLPADRATINEETLRDGEQTAGVNFLREDKLAIARLLAETLPGAIINAGYPPISQSEFEAVQAVAGEIRGAQIECAGRATRADFTRCFAAIRDAEYPRVAFWFPTSPLLLAARGHQSPAAVLGAAVDLVKFGRDLVGDAAGIDVALADVSRAEPAFVTEAAGRLAEAGADLLVLCDTVGRLLPHEVGPLVRAVAHAVPSVDLCFHGHNDLGNATANALEALRAGAAAVATTVNGLGERAGMASTDEVLANLHLRGDAIGRPLLADSTRLLRLSRLVAEASGIYPHANKPVVGASVLRRETGTQVDSMQRDPASFQLIPPEFLGADGIEIVIGKMSSHGSIAAGLAQRGIHLSPEEVQVVFDGVKELAGRQHQVEELDIHRLVAAARRHRPARRDGT